MSGANTLLATKYCIENNRGGGSFDWSHLRAAARQKIWNASWKDEHCSGLGGPAQRNA